MRWDLTVNLEAIPLARQKTWTGFLKVASELVSSEEEWDEMGGLSPSHQEFRCPVEGDGMIHVRLDPTSILATSRDLSSPGYLALPGCNVED